MTQPSRPFVEALEQRVLLSAVKFDLANASSSPSTAVTLGTTAFFAADDGIHGTELWATDGTTEGTRLVKDVNIGSAASTPSFLGIFNGSLFFTANDGTHGIEIWRTDGTPAGTALFKELSLGSSSASIASMTIFNGFAYFGGGSGLWKSDGTADGTVQLETAQLSGKLIAVGNYLFYVRLDSATGFELWRTDGTPGGSALVKDIYPGNGSSGIASLTELNGVLYFRGTTPQGVTLWRSDGTTEGTTMVLPPSSTFPREIVVVNGRLIFMNQSGTSPAVLWSSDGSSAGTVSLGSFPVVHDDNRDRFATFHVAGGFVYFAVSNAGQCQIWKTDGTSPGTLLVKEFSPTDPFTHMYALGDKAYIQFAGSDQIQVWETDNEHPNPVLLTSSLSFIDKPLGLINDKVLYGLGDPRGKELWDVDPITGKLTLIKDINTTIAPSKPSAVKNVNGTLFFLASGLWKSDGTPAGTTLIYAFPPASGDNDGGVVLGGRYVFTNGGSLWTSDGTPEGTNLLKVNIFPYPGGQFRMGVLGGIAVFIASTNQLWRTDGTPDGTFMLKTLPFTAAPAGINFVHFGDYAYFATTASDPVQSTLWRTDGTAQGTVAVRTNIYNLGAASVPPVAEYKGKLYYSTCDATACRVWSFDGTASGAPLGVYTGNPSNRPGYFTASNGWLFFTVAGPTVNELWKTNGTASGTTKVADLQATARNLIDFNNTLFFSMDTALWKIVGPSVVLMQVPAGIADFDPFRIVNGHLFYKTTSALWVTDGTNEGTKMVLPHPNNLFGNQIILDELNDSVFARAMTYTTGPDLYKIGLPIPRTSGPYTVGIGSSIRLDATTSSDPDPAETLSFTWDLDNDGVYGEIGVRATNGDEVGATPTFLVNNTLPGTYPISVRVTDSFGMSSRAFTSMRIAKIGDLNFDNQISIADFIQLASHFGQSPATWEDGDLNGDGAVTIADFIVLAANFGQSSAAAATPEAALSSTLTARKHGRTGSHHRFQRHKRPIQPTLLAKGWAEKR